MGKEGKWGTGEGRKLEEGGEWHPRNKYRGGEEDRFKGDRHKTIGGGRKGSLGEGIGRG